MLLPLFGLGQQGKSPAVTAQRHLNLYAEIQQEGEKSQVTFYGTPGLTLFAALGETPIRGMIEVGDSVFAVHRGIFYEINNAGVRTNRGTLNTASGRVELAYNGSQIGIVDGTNMYCYTIASNAFAVVSSGLFANPISIAYQDSYFIVGFRNSQQFQLSGQNDGNTFDALDFSSAESNPDGLVRIISDHGELVMCGTQTVEFWSHTGAQDFPYARSATIEYGVAAPWSMVKYNDSMAGLMRNQMGQVGVYVLAGHAPRKISTPDLDYLINKYSTVTDATAFAYMLGGHPMYQISFPTAGKSWLYDASTNLWTELESGLSGARHRAEIHVDYRGMTLVSDYDSGNIYKIDADAVTDNGAPIAREIVGKHYFQDFRRVSVSRLQLDMETGVGPADGSEPQVMLQISKDNGRIWGTELWTSMGAIGKYATRVIWRRLGSARDWLFKVRITDPVKVVLTAASIEATANE
jgi:hypothetical protein